MKNIAKYTITDIAKELGVTRQTIYYWIKKNWIMPKRDYRNYPVFSDKDLKLMKKWYSTLKEEKPPTNHTNRIKLPTNTTPVATPLTWEEIQKTLYKT